MWWNEAGSFDEWTDEMVATASQFEMFLKNDNKTGACAERMKQGWKKELANCISSSHVSSMATVDVLDSLSVFLHLDGCAWWKVKCSA